MTQNPYQPPGSIVEDSNVEPFCIWVTLVAGCAGYGAIFVVWMLTMPLWQQVLLASGVAMNELTRALYADPYLNVYRLVLNALAGVIAGALAVRFTQGRPYLHAMVATLPIYCVFISRYFAVYSVQYPAWSEFFAFALPVPFALLGARLQLHAVLAKRT